MIRIQYSVVKHWECCKFDIVLRDVFGMESYTPKKGSPWPLLLEERVISTLPYETTIAYPLYHYPEIQEKEYNTPVSYVDTNSDRLDRYDNLV